MIAENLFLVRKMRITAPHKGAAERLLPGAGPKSRGETTFLSVSMCIDFDSLSGVIREIVHRKLLRRLNLSGQSVAVYHHPKRQCTKSVLAF